MQYLLSVIVSVDYLRAEVRTDAAMKEILSSIFIFSIRMNGSLNEN